MARYGKKNTGKTVGVIALVALLAVGAAVGIGAAMDKTEDGFEKVHVRYEIGGLTDAGVYEESDGTLYTKNAFECNGTVYADLDFDANITYQLFYYDEDDKFIEATEVLTDDYKETAPENAAYCRVEITPIWAEDTEDEDKVIKWYNQAKYSEQLTISVEETSEKDTEEV